MLLLFYKIFGCLHPKRACAPGPSRWKGRVDPMSETLLLQFSLTPPPVKMISPPSILTEPPSCSMPPHDAPKTLQALSMQAGTTDESCAGANRIIRNAASRRASAEAHSFGGQHIVTGMQVSPREHVSNTSGRPSTPPLCGNCSLDRSFRRSQNHGE